MKKLFIRFNNGPAYWQDENKTIRVTRETGSLVLFIASPQWGEANIHLVHGTRAECREMTTALNERRIIRRLWRRLAGFQPASKLVTRDGATWLHPQDDDEVRRLIMGVETPIITPARRRVQVNFWSKKLQKEPLAEMPVLLKEAILREWPVMPLSQIAKNIILNLYKEESMK